MSKPSRRRNQHRTTRNTQNLHETEEKNRLQAYIVYIINEYDLCENSRTWKSAIAHSHHMRIILVDISSVESFVFFVKRKNITKMKSNTMK